MIRSMTGFARRERQFPWGMLAWELKTVNHRFLEIGCRLPEEFRSGEAEFRAAVAASVRRGKVDCSLFFRATIAANSLEVDAPLLSSLTQRAAQIATQAGAAARIDVMDILRWPGIVRDASRDMTPMLEAQAIAAEQYYRPLDPAAAAKNFAHLKLFTIEDMFGGWSAAQAAHFADGAAFDQMYSPGK